MLAMKFDYDRTYSSKNCRKSRVHIELSVLDGEGKDIKDSRISEIFSDIFLWDSSLWLARLEGLPNKNKYEILRTKSDFFWESLCQHFCQRIFGTEIKESIYLFGPSLPVTPYSLLPGMECSAEVLSFVSQRQDESFITKAERVDMKIFIDAGSDPLNPPGRVISFGANRASPFLSEISLDICLPSGTQVLGPFNEVLDMRPMINGSRTCYSDIIIRGLVRSQRERYKNTGYISYKD